MRKANYNKTSRIIQNATSGKPTIEALKFERYNIPLHTEPISKNEATWVTYDGGITGYFNLYPMFLLQLYNDSSTHKAIINSKADYIIGDGLLAGNKPVDIKVNPGETFTMFMRNCIVDYLIFKFFAVEVVYDRLNRPVELYHIPAQSIRTNYSKTHFWYSERYWYMTSYTEEFERWQPNQSDGNSKLFYFDSYSPAMTKVYPTPEYGGAITSIATEIAINEFNLNNIKNHFSASNLITFFMGSNVSDDVKRKALDELKRSYTGEYGNKILLDFQNPEGKAAEVTNLSPGDWDKAYTVIKEAVINDIMVGHQVTNPSLFGIQTPGKLGLTNELETSYSIFKDNYVRNRRNELASAFEMLLGQNGFVDGEISFMDRQLFESADSRAFKEKIMTLNELRKEAKLPPLPEGDQLLGQLLQGKGAQQGNTNSPNASVFADVKKKPEPFHLGEEHYEMIKDMGEDAEAYDLYDSLFLQFGKDEDIANYILEHSDLKVSDLKDAINKDLDLDISTSDLKDKIASMKEAGILGPDGNKAPNTKVQTMYRYDVRPGLGEPIIETTRPFCAKLVTNGRLYRRAEIQQMSAIFGYDIFQYGGGFYTDPDTGDTTPFCRHSFKQVTAVRKPTK